MLELRAHESLDLVREQPCRDEREEDGDWEGQGEGRGEKRRRRRKRNEPLDRTIERRRKQKKETAKIKRTDCSRLGLLHKLGSGRGRLCGRQGGEAAHVSESGRRSLFLKLDFFVVEGERVKTSIFFPLLALLSLLPTSPLFHLLLFLSLSLSLSRSRFTQHRPDHKSLCFVLSVLDFILPLSLSLTTFLDFSISKSASIS